MQTTIADRKLNAIKLLAKLEDEDLLVIIEQLLQQAHTHGDWAQDLTENEKSAIAEGLDDLNAGRAIDYDDFKASMKKRFP